jgi:tetratricopeptide (TPR) repeat protein
VRKADRAVLLNQLNSPTLGYDAAVDLVKQLKSLQPGEDARSNLFVQSWDTAVANAGQLTKLITDAQAQFERSMPAPDDSGKLPAISPDLASNIDSLSDAVKAFRAGSPPSAIRVPLQLADAMISCGEKIPALAKQIQAREILDAKSELDPLSSQAGVIGPKVSKILAAVQKKLAADIEKFQALRNEAKMLAENDKIEEALKKYQEAYAIIPAKDVAAQIDSLKKQ